MSSSRKSAASRANGAKSRGPKTAAGLAKASRNSLGHGFTSRTTLILQHENPVEFEHLLAQYKKTYRPETAEELDLVEQMVAARWRIRRLWTIETGLLDSEIIRQQPQMERTFKNIDPASELALSFRYLADESRSLALLTRYESRLSRMYDRAYSTLRELQSARRQQEMRNEPTAVEKGSDLNPLRTERIRLLPPARPLPFSPPIHNAPGSFGSRRVDRSNPVDLATDALADRNPPIRQAIS